MRVKERQRTRCGAGKRVVVHRLVGAISDSERVQAPIVIWGRGDLARLRDALDLAEQDWRDVAVRADLADEDWPLRLGVELGPTADTRGDG